MSISTPASLTMIGTRLDQNVATTLGGGAILYYATGQMTSCSLTANQAATTEGGIWTTGTGIVRYNNTIFQQNTAQDGGGMWNDADGDVLTNCSFLANTATRNGGAIYDGTDTQAQLKNCLLAGNTATSGSAQYSNTNTSTFLNSNIWGNTGGAALAHSLPTITYSDVQGGFAGTGNINTDPLFTNAGAGNYILQASSLAVNTGNPGSTTTTISATDLAGNQRIIDSRIDMGPYKVQAPSPISLTPAISPTALCAGTDVALSVNTSGGTRPYSYTWVAPAGITLSATNTSAVTGTTSSTLSGSQTFTVTVVSSGGSPTSTTTISLLVNALPTASLNPAGTVSCNTPTVTLIAGGGTSYTFSTGASQVNGPSGNTATVITGGTYAVTVANASGCKSTTTATVSSNTTAPTPTLINSGPISATSLTATLTASGGTSYTFSSGATSTGANTATVNSPGTYTVTVSNAQGCTAIATTTITGAANTATICRNGTAIIKVVASGSPVKYEWYKNTLNSARLADITNLQRGTATASLTLINQQVTANYYVRVTDANGSAIVYGPFKVIVDMGCIVSVGGRLAAEEVELKMTLAPNPLNGEQLRAVVRGAAGRSLLVELHDLSGRPVRQQSWQQAEAEQVVEWNLSGQASGVYLLEATTQAEASSSAQRHTVKVIKP